MDSLTEMVNPMKRQSFSLMRVKSPHQNQQVIEQRVPMKRSAPVRDATEPFAKRIRTMHAISRNANLLVLGKSSVNGR